MIRVKSPQDLGAGLLFIFIGLVGLYFGKDLTFGSARSMGPGFFPMWLSSIIVAMGAICATKSIALQGPEIERVTLKPILFVFAGVLLFGYLTEYVKLELSLILLTLVVTQSRRDMDLAQKILIATCTILGVGVLCAVFPPLAAFKFFGDRILEASPWIIIALFLAVAILTRGEAHQRQMLLLALGMAIVSVIVFVVLLGQPMPTITAEYFTLLLSKMGSLFATVKGA
jgi:hypothetical protein